ncbi:alkene reductase [Afifella sp. IM 167]|uniref:alkene reductase n=1 Tax=Afifella sp. IM 167 TaxID=2033586 RepID=UPI001CCBF7B1|nr:alkene reductase [Afifella sp. IM 167]MBZ8131677.1 alkene reductase [Afifella sp. IM 167]
MHDNLPKLFQPIDLGPTSLSNRIVMAPLTRSRADENDAPREMHVEYYRQRATAGLIIAEATQITQQGKGYAFTPGIHSDLQVERWQKVTDAVHEAGGKMFLQLWHVGRISHPDLQPNGGLPVAPSAVKPDVKAFTETGFKDIPEPRALAADELPGIVEDYRRAAQNAKNAGFDGVEVHSANGYLLDQFLRDKTNRRHDTFGGSIDNRMRFPLQVVDAVTEVWGPEHVGIRISPVSPANDCADSDPEPLFRAYVRELSERGLAYLHVIEGATRGPRQVEGAFDVTTLKQEFSGLYIGNNGYDRALAISAVEEGKTDLVAFGRPFISNPDLVERLKSNAPLAEWDETTFYGGGEHGYTDYPPLSAGARAAQA